VTPSGGTPLRQSRAPCWYPACNAAEDGNFRFRRASAHAP
jgi:hypothetical protein